MVESFPTPGQGKNGPAQFFPTPEIMLIGRLLLLVCRKSGPATVFSIKSITDVVKLKVGTKLTGWGNTGQFVFFSPEDKNELSVSSPVKKWAGLILPVGKTGRGKLHVTLVHDVLLTQPFSVWQIQVSVGHVFQ